MTKVIKNASQLPKRYFGLHMCEGVAQYQDNLKSEPYRIFINESTCKQMDSTYEGKPLYVHHVDDVNLEQLQNEADGYVVRSFYNKADGKHWAEFMVVSDIGHKAIADGWKLSNAYIPKDFGAGGKWHAVEYAKEVLNGEYEHLAIVPNPRYTESVILSPEEFKEYNLKKETELKKLANSKESEFMFFKKTKMENAVELESTMVQLPKSKREVSLKTLINEADAAEEKKGEEMANEDHHVMVGKEKMKVNDLVKKYQDMMEAKENEVEEEENEVEVEVKEEEEKPKENEEDKEKEKEEKKANALKLKNAEKEAALKNTQFKVIETSDDKLVRGRKLF